MARYRVLRLLRADGTTVRAKSPDGKEREVPDVVTKTLEHDWNPELGDQLGEDFVMKSLVGMPFGDGHVRFVVKGKDGDADDRGGKDRDPGEAEGGGEVDDEDDYSGPEDALKPQILTAFDAWKAYKKGEQPDVEAPAWCKPVGPQESPVLFSRRAAGEFAKLPAAKAAMESVGSGVDWEDWVTAVMRYEHHEAVRGGTDQGAGADRGQKGNGGADAGDSVEKGMAAFDLVERMEGEVAKGLDIDLSDALSGLDMLAKGAVQVGPRGGHYVAELGGKRYVSRTEVMHYSRSAHNATAGASRETLRGDAHYPNAEYEIDKVNALSRRAYSLGHEMANRMDDDPAGYEESAANHDMAAAMHREIAQRVRTDTAKATHRGAANEHDAAAKSMRGRAEIVRLENPERVEKSLDADSMAGMDGLRELASGTPVAEASAALQSDLAKGDGIAALEGFAVADADPHELAMGIEHEAKEHG
jgi:hypothetical protein